MPMLTYLVIPFLYGINIGSFLNVCIYRIPIKENFTTTRSHCRSCGYQLRWYDLFPLISYIILGGKCRSCKTKISLQYPMIEVLNGILYIFIFMINGFSFESVIYCLMTSALLVLSVIDFRTFEIPSGINWFIGGLGIARVALDYQHFSKYIIGFCCVSGFLLLLYVITKGRGIGGGDIKIMAVSGLVLGYRKIIIGFLLGCIIGSVVHLHRMKISNEERQLAFGPYLSIGIYISILYGEQMVNWYLKLFL